MNTQKRFLVLLSFLFSTQLSWGQETGKYSFFKGDTLQGFDLKGSLKSVEDEHFSEKDLITYLQEQERQFVNRKYHIPSAWKTLPLNNYVLTSGCTNPGFETGDYTDWTGYIGVNNNSDSAVTLVTAGITNNTLGIDAPETSCSMFTLVNAAAGNDPYGGFAMLDPLAIGGAYSLRLGGENANLRSGSTCTGPFGLAAPGESIQQSFVVTAANAMFTYNYAVVLVQVSNGHTPAQCPYFRAEVLDQNGKPIPCLQYYVESVGSGVPPGMAVSALTSNGQPVYYANWAANTLNLKNYIGQTITVRFSAAGCVPGGHWGYAYVDASCSAIQVIAASPEVCLGGTNTLTAPGAGATGTYSWTTVPPGGPGIIGSSTGQTVTINASGTYEVTVTQAPGCFYTIDTTLTFYPVPTVTVTGTNPSCSPGHDGTAIANVTGGNTPYTYSWSPSGGMGDTAKGLNPGTYTVTVTTINGCSDQGTVTLVPPLPAPVITITNTPATCSPGKDGTATANVTGGATPYTYSWTGGTVTNGQGTNSISGLNAGTYTLTVTSLAGACPSSDTTVITQPNGPLASSTNTNVSCFGLSDGTATVTGSGGSAPLSYSWSPNTGATNSVSGLSAGVYTCVTSDSKGCVVTSVVTITQPTLLTVKANGTNATCHNLCNGGLICVPAGGTTTYTYSWNSGCNQASCMNVCPGLYTATIIDAHGCTANDTITISEPLGMTLSMAPVPSHCGRPDGRDTVHVTGGNPGYTYQWLPSGGTGTVATGLTAGVYSVIITDSHGCKDTVNNSVPDLPGVNIALDSTLNILCFGGSGGMATITASGGYKPYTYSWNPGGQTTPVVTNLTAGVYTCNLIDSAGCKNSVVATIVQPPLLTVTATPALICLTNCTNLTCASTGGTVPYTYTWSLNGVVLPSTHVCPPISTTYTVTCTDAHGCVTTNKVLISVNPALEVLASGAKGICPGSSTVLNAIGSGGNGGPYNYLWSPATGLSNIHVANPTASPTVTTTYTVIVSDNCGTPTDSDQVTITVFPIPVVTLTAKDSVTCGPNCVKFTGTSNPACASAVWNFGDGTTGTGCNSAAHCYPTAGTYTIAYNVTDVNGCPGSKSITPFFNVLSKPNAAFVANPQPTTILDSIIYFTDQSSGGGGIASWSWSFGDFSGATSTLQNPHYAYPDTGCFPVILIVTGNDGCMDTVEHPVCILPYFTFYAPNTFTPNGDGKNDIWMPFGVGIDPKHYHLMMFDRWGNLMFETYTWGEGWDGRANGGVNIAQIDTYVWKVDLKDVLHEKHQYIGHCNIIK